MDVGRATKSFGRDADDEELATIYEYLTHLPSFRSALPWRGETVRAGPVERASGARDNQPPPTYLIRNAISRSSERGHTMCGIAGWVSYKGDANVPSETPSQQSRDNRRKRRAAPSGELDTLGHQSSTGLKRL